MIGALRFVLRTITKHGSPSEVLEAEEHLRDLEKFNGMPRVQDLINRHPMRRGIVADTGDIEVNAASSQESIERFAKDLDALGKGVENK